MNVAASSQSRLLLLVGALAAVALAVFMVTRLGLLSGSDETPTPAAAIARTPAESKAVTPANPVAQAPAKKAPAKAVVKLNPGLPVTVAKALRRENVVVAAVWAPRAVTRRALGQARTGATQSGAGFVALNVLDEDRAGELQTLVGPISDPAVLVFRRPGTIVNRFDGFADSVTVAQAARDAGAK